MFSLECAAIHGLSAAQVNLVSRNIRVFSKDGELRVGRTVQPTSVWQALVPDERLQNTISREHFKIVYQASGGFELENVSAGGTLVNGKRLTGRSPIRNGDLVGVGLATPEGHPVLTLRFLCNNGEGVGGYISGSASTLPNPLQSSNSMLPTIMGSAISLPSASGSTATVAMPTSMGSAISLPSAAGSTATVAMPTSTARKGIDTEETVCKDEVYELLSKIINPSSTIEMPIRPAAKGVSEDPRNNVESYAVDVGTITLVDAVGSVNAAELPPAVYSALLPPDAVRGIVDTSWMSQESSSQSEGIRLGPR